MCSPCVCALFSSKLWLQVSCKCHRNLGLAGHSCSHLMHEGHRGCLYLHCPWEPKNGVSVPCPTSAASWAYSSAWQLPSPSPSLPNHPAPVQLDTACCLLLLALRPATCTCLPALQHIWDPSLSGCDQLPAWCACTCTAPWALTWVYLVLQAGRVVWAWEPLHLEATGRERQWPVSPQRSLQGIHKRGRKASSFWDICLAPGEMRRGTHHSPRTSSGCGHTSCRGQQLDPGPQPFPGRSP